MPPTNNNSPTHVSTLVLNNNNNAEDDNDDTTTAPPSIDSAAMAIAEHLDQLESSDDITDITSFQDIELPPAEPSSNDVESNSANEQQHADSIRRAKKFYYCLPMIQQYKYAIVSCLGIFALVVLAVSLSASSLAKSNEALDTANNNAANGGGDGDLELVIDDIPNDSAEYEGEGDEELGPALEAKRVTDPPTDAPRGDPGPSSTSIIEPSPTPFPTTNNPTTLPPTDKPMEPPHPLNPQWFETNDVEYQTIVETHDTYAHSHEIAGLFCTTKNLYLCTYNEYCPNGQSSPPYNGGPLPPKDDTIPNSPLNNNINSLEEVQWAPIYTNDTTNQASSAGGGFWVQVGTIPESDGGNDDNGFGMCWTWDKWDNRDIDDIEIVWGVDHRRWILCCEMEDDGGGGGGER